MLVNSKYESSLGQKASKEDFNSFIDNISKTILDKVPDDELDKDIKFLSKRIAQNMFYYPENIDTAKTDYIYFLGLLKRKGVI